MTARKLTYPTCRQPSEVTFGTGSVRTLAALDLEGAALFVSGQEGVQQVLAAAFERQGIRWDSLRALTKPDGEPTSAAVGSAAAWLGRSPFKRLIAVGGGSVLDWARLALAVNRGWLDLDAGIMQPRLQPRDRPELVLVPTTCGSGAEAAAVAVYTSGGRKVPVVSDAFLADRVVLDAQFLSLASRQALASWVSDALSHSIEACVSIVPGALAKHAALGALRAILEHYAAAESSSRRERLMEAGFLGGVAASNCSVGVVHAFAHTISAYGIPHGVANAMGLPAGIAVNAETAEMRALLRLAGLPSAEALIDAIVPITSAALTGNAAAEGFAALRRPEERNVIAERMLSDVCLRTNPRRLDHDGVMAFLGDVDRTVTSL